MKLQTKLSAGPPYTLIFKMNVSDSERESIERAGAMEQNLFMSDSDAFPSINLRSFLTGSSFQTDRLDFIQIMEWHIDTAAKQLRMLLDTFDKFGQTRFKEY